MTSPTPIVADSLAPLSAASAEVLNYADTTDPADVARCSYRLIWAAASNGKIPVERIGGRWFIRRSDVPTIAAALGLKVPVAAKLVPSNLAVA